MKNILPLTLAILFINTTDIQSIEKQPLSDEDISIKFAAYNVLFGLWGDPESIGKNLKMVYMTVSGN